jgi:hypothetical protein
MPADVPLFVAMTIQAALATLAGREDQARLDTGEALAASQRCGANLLVVWTLTTLASSRCPLAITTQR